MVGTAAPALSMTDEQRSGLEAMARSPSLPHRQVRQARALTLAADGVANAAIAREVGVTANSVRAWRARFEAAGIDEVGKVAPGLGRKPTITPAQVEAIVADTLDTRRRHTLVDADAGGQALGVAHDGGQDLA